MADNFNLRTFLTENKLTKNTQLLNEGMYYVTINIPSRKMDIGSRQEASSEEEAVEKAKKYIEQDSPGVEYIIKSVSLRKEAQPSTMDLSKVDTNSIEIDGVDPNDRPDFADAYISYAEYEDGTPLTDGELDELTSEMPDLVNQLANDSLYEKAQNNKPTMKETKLTAKERRLVEMVNNAMGMQEEENVDYTMGRQDDPNQLPNPAPELNIPEGEDMVEEKPMPKYESIDQLMKEIEHGTNEAAHKYKMEEMKRIYELLETKVTSLEEGENAEHIDQSKVKQMRKDIAALRKAEEKLRKEFEKKFNKKEKPAAAPKAEKEAATEAASEALQEGTFDLRKFLVENKMTTNSRMLKEDTNIGIGDIVTKLSEAGIKSKLPVTYIVDYGNPAGTDPAKTTSVSTLVRQLVQEVEGSEDVDVMFNTDITQGQGELLGDNEPQTQGLTCKLEVYFEDSKMYEIWQ